MRERCAARKRNSIGVQLWFCGTNTGQDTTLRFTNRTPGAMKEVGRSTSRVGFGHAGELTISLRSASRQAPNLSIGFAASGRQIGASTRVLALTTQLPTTSSVTHAACHPDGQLWTPPCRLPLAPRYRAGLPPGRLGDLWRNLPGCVRVPARQDNVFTDSWGHCCANTNKHSGEGRHRHCKSTPKHETKQAGDTQCHGRSRIIVAMRHCRNGADDVATGRCVFWERPGDCDAAVSAQSDPDAGTRLRGDPPPVRRRPACNGAPHADGL